MKPTAKDFQNMRHQGGIAAAAILVVLSFAVLSTRWTGAGKRPEEVHGLDSKLSSVQAKLQADPQDAQALVESGVLLYQKGKDSYYDAINQLEDAWKLGALDPRIFYYLGSMYQELGLYPNAVEWYRRFLTNNPNDRETRLLLAKLLYQNGRYDEALVHYRRLSERAAGDSLVKENTALTMLKLSEQRRPSDAAEADSLKSEAVKRLQALDSAGPLEKRRAHFYLAQVCADDKDYHQAMRYLADVLPLEEQPDLGILPESVYILAATVYDKLKLPKVSTELWRKALQANPENARSKSALRLAESDLRRQEAARKREIAAAKRAAQRKKKT